METIKIEIIDNLAAAADWQSRKDAGMAPALSAEWCSCGELEEFGCYPEDGECSCGTYKHHVHCGRCGKISQIG